MRKNEIEEIIEEMNRLNGRLLSMIKREREAEDIMADASDAIEDAVSCLETL